MPSKTNRSTSSNQNKGSNTGLKLTAANIERFLGAQTYKSTHSNQDKDEVGSGICYNRWKPKV